MTAFLIYLFFIGCLAIFWWGLSRKSRLIQFPFLAAAVFLGWMFPQMIGMSNLNNLPQGALEKTLIMAIFCLAASFLGYVINSRPAKIFDWQLSYKRLLWCSLYLSALGAYFFITVNSLAADATAEFGGQWTGVITIYVFFSRMLNVGFVIALIVHLNRPSKLALSIIIFDSLFYIHRIFILGRRAAMVELFLMLLLALWFNRKWVPSRTLVVAALFFGAMVVNSIGDYRAVMLGDNTNKWSSVNFSDILNIDYLGNFQRIADGDAMNTELLNAALTIEAVDRTMNFDYGFSLWNAVVHNYVPAQIVGKDIKQAMVIDTGNSAQQVFWHEAHTGSTQTGLADAFNSFWFFGAIKFFLIGYIMNRWYRAAVNGNLVAQMIVMLTASASLHAITHTTHHYFVTYIWLAAFLLPIVTFSRIKKSTD